ncbi:FAD-dependent oxidoreductase [Nocardioides houyundeii]|uniref:FAD-dependent oxidoreductase n=1 Tax=Nocardioides houyundeii TaxID=2045452 RepID=UPI000DF18AF6|nr:FAD-dependent oxidoreductase [Nocardioides houyundeii]
MTERIVIIGADAAGMSAAHQALRTAEKNGRDLQVTVLDKGRYTSYSACGIPYWMAGDVPSGDALVGRTPAEHREAGIDLRLESEVTAVDLAGRQVKLADGQTVEYDQLVVATGAPAAIPPWAHAEDGTPYDRVGPVKTLEDGEAWLGRFARAGEGAHLVIVGGNYIGVEMAEIALKRGLGVTVLTRSRVMSLLEPEMSERVALALTEAGVEVILDAEITGLRVCDGVVCGVEWEDGGRDCDLVVLAVGVEPATGFLADSGLPMGPSGGLRAEPTGRVADGVWAAGDCCEVRRRLVGDWAFLPLGTHANKAGRALGDNLGGGSLTFDGVLETSITRFEGGGQYLEIARTGLSVDDAREAGFDPVSLLTPGSTASGYMLEAEPMDILVTADRGSRRLLGVQIVGGHGSGKRIDTAAAVLWHEGTVDDLAWMDLSYSPPFSTAWEVLQVAARRVAEQI